MKLFKNTLSIYIRHIGTALLSVIIAMALYRLAEDNPLIFSSITALIYIIVIYSTSWNMGKMDSRKIPGYYPNPKMPIYLSLFTAIVPIILLVIRMAAPNTMPLDIPVTQGTVDFWVRGCKIFGTPDFLYRLWYFPFAAFIPSGNVFVYFAMIFVSPILIFAGYYVGLTRFNIMSFLYSKIVFTGKDKDSEDDCDSIKRQ